MKEYDIWWSYMCKQASKYTKWSGNNHADVAEAMKCSLLLEHNILQKSKQKWAWRQASLWEADFKLGFGVVMFLRQEW